MFASGSLRRGRGLLVLAVVALLGVAVAGCTSFFNHNLVTRDETPAKLISDAALTTTKPLSAGGDGCVSPVMEPDRSQILQEALGDSQLQAVRAKLESRGLPIDLAGAMALHVADGEEVLIPFGQQAYLIWSHHQTQTTAVGTIQQGGKTLNITADGADRWVRVLTSKQAQKLLKQLRQKDKFKEFEKQLKQQGKNLADGRIKVLLDETRGTVAIGLTTADSAEGRFTHQTRVRVKAGKDDELDDNAEPLVQETACASAGKASTVSAAPRTQVVPQLIDCSGGCETGDPPIITLDTNAGQLCTSIWGYDYACLSYGPLLKISTTSVQLATFIGGFYPQTSFVIWNFGSGILQGTLQVAAPFSFLVKSANLGQPTVATNSLPFSLTAGQPLTVVVQFSPTAAGQVNSLITIQSNTSNPQNQSSVTAKGVAVTEEDFLNVLSGISQQTELTAVIPTNNNVDIELTGFRSLSVQNIKTFIQLGQNWSQGSLVGTPPTLDQVPGWVTFLVRFLLTQLLNQLIAKKDGFDISVVVGNLENLASQLKISQANFDSLYNAWKGSGNFGQLINALVGALQDAAQNGGGAIITAFCGCNDAAQAVKNIIQSVAAMYNTGRYTTANFEQFITNFGIVGIITIAAAKVIDPSERVLQNLFKDMVDIILDQQRFADFFGGALWQDLARAMSILAAYAGNLFDSGLTKQFNEIMAALAVTDKMANTHQWQIFAFRTSYDIGFQQKAYVDVAGVTTVENQKYVIFGQFFHAVDGFSPGDLEHLLTFLGQISGHAVEQLSGLSYSLIEALSNGDKVGAVVAVNQSNVNLAGQIINANICTQCFVILISVDDNGIVTNIAGYGIPYDVALTIARRMGFVIGQPAPWAQTSSGPWCGAGSGLRVSPAMRMYQIQKYC